MPRAGDGERPLPQPRRQEHRPHHRGGRERLRAARTVHGCHGAEGRAFRAAVADLLAQGRRLRLIRALRQHATG